ncbi:MAG TPA: hypothetical protein VHA56_10890 [Mucilaginibacter sp.]|nr:hypothetical protein [Mucilaginibacter sp.]
MGRSNATADFHAERVVIIRLVTYGGAGLGAEGYTDAVQVIIQMIIIVA